MYLSAEWPMHAQIAPKQMISVVVTGAYQRGPALCNKSPGIIIQYYNISLSD
jgi:hypothetical protein